MPSRNVRGRMLFWKVSYNQQIPKVSVWAKLLFTWLIPNIDNMGRMEGNAYAIKGMIFPYETKITPEKCRKLLQELHNVGLIILYQVNGCEYLCVPGISKNQKLVGNMRAESDYPELPIESVKEWERKTGEIYTGIYKYIPVLTEGKGREGEEKNKNISILTQEFFAYFLFKTGKTLKLTPERSAIIEKRLKDGRTLEELKKAVDNFTSDDWQDRHNFIDIIYCVGVRNKVDNLDKWINFKPKPGRYIPQPKKDCSVCNGTGKISVGPHKGSQCFCY
ncbi:MAG: hypothetical protein QME65_05220 [Candidatus Omnitrophota bacterium]|nr:hypothetical protein [Candidatus Omnitrophota bacterium]